MYKYNVVLDLITDLRQTFVSICSPNIDTLEVWTRGGHTRHIVKEHTNDVRMSQEAC